MWILFYLILLFLMGFSTFEAIDNLMLYKLYVCPTPSISFMLHTTRVSVQAVSFANEIKFSHKRGSW